MLIPLLRVLPRPQNMHALYDGFHAPRHRTRTARRRATRPRGFDAIFPCLMRLPLAPALMPAAQQRAILLIFCPFLPRFRLSSMVSGAPDARAFAAFHLRQIFMPPPRPSFT